MLDLDGVLARVRSTSYVPQEGAAAAALLDEIRALVAQHAHQGSVVMVMRTIVVAGDAGADGA